jgi:hypothetical protein
MTRKIGKTTDKMEPYNLCQMKYSIIYCYIFSLWNQIKREKLLTSIIHQFIPL